ncbi:MAG: hypothetical protein C0501_16235 [Isosphaera sp.]|nr:hypothetical protein [Isosphaera sp.]
MPVSPDDPMPGRTAARWLSGILVAMILWVLAVWLAPQLRPLRVPTVYAVLAAGGVVLVLAVRFAAAGRDRTPVGPLLAGWAVWFGGAAADILATVTHTPDLAREANPLIRALLDAGWPVDAVYAYGAVSQAVFVAVGAVLWVAFLKHRTDLVRLMPPSGSLLAYFKAGTGARELSYRQWLCPLTAAELPWGYHYACWGAVCFVGIGAARFYAAAEWHRLVEPTVANRVVAGTVMLLVVCVAYAWWLKAARRALPDAGTGPDGPATLPV